MARIAARPSSVWTLTQRDLPLKQILLFCRAIRHYGDTEVSLTVSEDNCGSENTIQYLEHVVVIIRARFDWRGYLEGYVTSPSGTTSQILPYRANDVIATDFSNWPILSLHFWGEVPRGTWKLRLRNNFPEYSFSGKTVLHLDILHNCSEHCSERLTSKSIITFNRVLTLQNPNITNSRYNEQVFP